MAVEPLSIVNMRGVFSVVYGFVHFLPYVVRTVHSAPVAGAMHSVLRGSCVILLYVAGAMHGVLMRTLCMAPAT